VKLLKVGERSVREMIKVIFKRRYEFRELNNRVCIVEVILPADEEGWLIKELRDSKTTIFGWTLNKDWAHYDKSTNTRYCEMWETGSSWEELEEEIDSWINDALDRLRKVYKKNIEEIKKKPCDREEMYILED
jgi:hypothetical protein